MFNDDFAGAEIGKRMVHLEMKRDYLTDGIRIFSLKLLFMKILLGLNIILSHDWSARQTKQGLDNRETKRLII